MHSSASNARHVSFLRPHFSTPALLKEPEMPATDIDAENTPDWSLCLLKCFQGQQGTATDWVMDWLGKTPKVGEPRAHAVFRELLFNDFFEPVQLIQGLLNCGANPKATTAEGETPLMLAAYNGDTECIKLLLPLSDAKAVSKWGRTALMIAAGRENPAFVELLLPHSDPLAVNHIGQTALMVAARQGAVGCVKLLVEKSDIFAVDDEKKDAFSSAMGLGREIRNMRGSASESDFFNCADILAPFLDEKRLRVELKKAPTSALPVARATVERHALEAVVKKNKKGAEPAAKKAAELSMPAKNTRRI